MEFIGVYHRVWEMVYERVEPAVKAGKVSNSKIGL